MTNGITDLGGGHAPRELDASSGAFVNDTAPGVDGSTLGIHTVPASFEATGQRFALSERLRGRGPGLFAAALAGGLLALGWTLFGGRRRTRGSRTFAGFALGGRPRRRWFTR
jgi:hypothetical protein